MSSSNSSICACIETSSAETARRRSESPAPPRARVRCRCAGAGRRKTGAGNGGSATGDESDQVHQFAPRAATPRLRVAPKLSGPSDDGRADGAARVERAVRVLKDHLHLAPERGRPDPRSPVTSAPSTSDLAARRLDQAREQPRQGGYFRIRTRRRFPPCHPCARRGRWRAMAFIARPSAKPAAALEDLRESRAS